MAKDWKKLDIKGIAKGAAKKTDDKLAGEIASLSRLTDADVKNLFPEKGDVEKLIELMRIVKSADSHNKKVNQLVANSEKFGSIVVSLLTKLV